MLRFNVLQKMQFYCLLSQLFSLYSCTDLYSDDVKSYDSEKFKENVGTGIPHFINFYAPWCGYCKRLKPVWDDLAEKHNTLSLRQNLVIAKIDCTSETPLCDNEGVISYPSLIFYPAKEKEGKKFNGKRDLLSLEKFISDNLDPDRIPEADSSSLKEHVIELSDDNFHDAVDTGLHFVKFHAPWCGHCQKLVPLWDELAFRYYLDKSFTISKVDCTVNKRTCDEFEIKGYPTLLWIADGKMIEQFNEDRLAKNLEQFIVKMKAQFKGSADSEDDKPRLVINLTDSNFAAEVSSGISFVKFYAPWCGHSKRLEPIWKELAQKLVKHDNVKIAKIDCTEYEDICNDFKVLGFPSLLLFHNGKYITEYQGPRKLEQLHSFVHENIVKSAHDEL